MDLSRQLAGLTKIWMLIMVDSDMFAVRKFALSSPCRLSLIGGGIDDPIKNKFEIAILSIPISVTADLYARFTSNPLDNSKSEFGYSILESVSHPAELNHMGFRSLYEEIYSLSPNSRIQVFSSADTKSGSGLGASGAFYVNLQKLFNNIYNVKKTWDQVAFDAYKSEYKNSRAGCGIQDHLAASFARPAIFIINGTSIKAIPFFSGFLDLLNYRLFLIPLNRFGSSYGNTIEHNSYYSRMLEINNEFLSLVNRECVMVDEIFDLINSQWENKRKYMGLSHEATSLNNQIISAGAKVARICGAGERGYFAALVEEASSYSFREKFPSSIKIPFYDYYNTTI